MSTQNAMRQIKLTNLRHIAARLRQEIGTLERTIRINLDTSMTRPENLQVEVIDSQWDELKAKWAELSLALADIKRLEEELK